MSIVRSKFAPISICLAFGLVACGDDGKSTDDAVTTVADTTAPTDTTAPATSATDAPETSATDADTTVDEPDDVMLADSDVGQILVDAAGMTLYLFANDPPDTATCTGGCASTWPPLLTDSDHAHVGDGLDDDMFTVVAGQLSFNGHPLYYYAGDSAPGDTNGQGVGGVWFVLDADGNAIT